MSEEEKNFILQTNLNKMSEEDRNKLFEECLLNICAAKIKGDGLNLM